jgi:hypothetical protein
MKTTQTVHVPYIWMVLKMNLGFGPCYILKWSMQGLSRKEAQSMHDYHMESCKTAYQHCSPSTVIW